MNYIDTYTKNLNRVELKYIGEVKEISSDIEALSIIHWKIAQEQKSFSSLKNLTILVKTSCLF